MKRRILFTLISLISFINAHYQDIIINNMLLASGSFECPARYEAIKKVLNSCAYKRPITVLDLGASEGYFGFSIARDYQAVSVMIEGNYQAHSHEEIADRLEELCKENTDIPNIILLKKHITPQELKLLSECEHFDIVLALNFIHTFGSHWKDAADSIFALGDYIIVESPSHENKNAGASDLFKHINDYLVSKKGKVLGKFPSHFPDDKADTMWLFSPYKTALERLKWSDKPMSGIYKYLIKSTQMEKTLHYNGKKYHWFPGINLLTFKILNGVFPSSETIEHITGKFSHEHDVRIGNYIVQGTKVIKLDEKDPRYDVVPKKQ